jgi:prepilin-type processing-associated H-X9-DG protein
MVRISPNRMFGFSRFDVLASLFIVCVLAVVMCSMIRPYTSERALQASCLSNEKQLGLAFVQYAQDYDNTYPCGTRSAPLRVLASGWAGQIYPYVKSAGVYRCPDDRPQPSSDGLDQAPESYAYNWNIGNASLFSTNKDAVVKCPAKVSDFRNPSRTVLLCEAFGTMVDVSGSHGIESTSPAVLGGNEMPVGSGSGFLYATGVLRNDPTDAAVVGSDNGDAMKTGVHTGSSNFLLADGHAKWLKPDWVSAGGTNNIGSNDCTAEQGLNPVGKAGDGHAAGTACADPILKATFSVK